MTMPSYPFSSIKKAEQRDIVLQAARRPYPFRSMVLLPGEGCLDVRTALMLGIADENTEFVFIEKDPKARNAIQKFIDDRGLNATLLYHSGGIEAGPDLVVKKPIDGAHLDTCNQLTDRVFAWQARSFLKNPDVIFDRGVFMAFTYCLNTRGLDLPYVNAIDKALKNIEVDDLQIMSDHSFAQKAQWEATAQALYRAQYMLIPGHVMNGKALVYLSSETPMVTLMFDVYIDSVIAHDKWFRLVDGFGFDLKSPAPATHKNKKISIEEVAPSVPVVVAEQSRKRASSKRTLETRVFIDTKALVRLVRGAGTTVADVGIGLGYKQSFLKNIVSRGCTSQEHAAKIAKFLGVSQSAFVLPSASAAQSVQQEAEKPKLVRGSAERFHPIAVDHDKLSSMIAATGMTRSAFSVKAGLRPGSIMSALNRRTGLAPSTVRSITKILGSDEFVISD